MKYTVDNTAAIGKPVRVSVNGVDVTSRCRECDPDLGYAICAKVDVYGKMVLEGDSIAEERLVGDVVVTPVVRAS